VYVVPPLANNPHQRLVGFLFSILREVVEVPEEGQVLPGANVSDRRAGWEQNFRDPDVVVVLADGQAVDCGTHWFGGPDFLVEVKSPRDETEEKIPFYSQLKVRELLIVHRDSHQVRLFRHDGQQLVPVKPTILEGQKWLVSEVVPLAFRRVVLRGQARIEVCRTNDPAVRWTL
jgi:Uma2 family endonuclease